MMTGYPIAWIHVATEESADENSRSMENIGEAIACINLAALLIGQHKMHGENTIIIMLYSQNCCLVLEMMWTQYALTVGIDEHLVNKFHLVVLPISVKNQCHLYMAPMSTYVAGWAEIVVSDVQQRVHDHIVSIISNRLQNYDEMRLFRDTSLCGIYIYAMIFPD
uniref:Uncharacterized protein n=1 Tax=Romanomermis culicivorax TaxID=13658 RepID=A0A915IE85_ROMCU